jgi:hypothetical protein
MKITRRNSASSTKYTYKNTIKSICYIFTLFASGQTFANGALYWSIPASPNLITLSGADWDAGGCPGATAVGGGLTNDATDYFGICAAGNITALSGTVPILGTLVISSGASVAAGGDVTFSGSLLRNSGTLNMATSRLVMAASSTLENDGTLTLGSPAQAHSLFNFTHKDGTGSNLGNAVILGDLTVSSASMSGTSLTLTAANTVAGNLTLNHGAISDLFQGVLKFTTGNHTITATGAQVIPTLNVSGMATGNTITTAGTGNVTITNPIVGGSLACPSGTPYVVGSTIATGTICTVTVTVIQAVAAPIDFSFSHKKPEIYSREIKIK